MLENGQSAAKPKKEFFGTFNDYSRFSQRSEQQWKEEHEREAPKRKAVGDDIVWTVDDGKATELGGVKFPCQGNKSEAVGEASDTQGGLKCSPFTR